MSITLRLYAPAAKTDKTGFSDKVTDRISMAYEKNVHIGRPVHKRSFAGFGDHHRINVFRINCDVVWQDRKPIDQIKIVEVSGSRALRLPEAATGHLRQMTTITDGSQKSEILLADPSTQRRGL